VNLGRLWRWDRRSTFVVCHPAALDYPSNRHVGEAASSLTRKFVDNAQEVAKGTPPARQGEICCEAPIIVRLNILVRAQLNSLFNSCRATGAAASLPLGHSAKGFSLRVPNHRIHQRFHHFHVNSRLNAEHAKEIHRMQSDSR